MSEDPDDPPPELLDIWRQLDESRRVARCRVRSPERLECDDHRCHP